MARILYPRLFQPVPTTPETVTADRWMQPPSQPVITRTQSAAVRASGASPSPAPVITAAETVTLDKWFQPASLPPPAKRGLTEAIDTSDGAVGSPAPIAAPGTTWDAGFCAATLALTNGNLTATGTASNVLQVVRSTSSRSSGKVYWEVTLGTVTSTICVGFGISTVTTATNLAATPGAVCTSVGAAATQTTFLNSVNLNAGSTASVSGEIVSIALDIPNKLLWVSDAVMRAASTPWNNSATANPSTNTGGQALTALPAGPYFAMFMAYETGGAATANFGASAFSQSVPTGFTAWDATAEVVLEDKWHQPASQPSRAPARTAALASSGASPSPAPPAAAPEVVTLDKWHQPASLPVAPRSRAAALASGTVPSPAPGAPETVTADRWMQPPVQPPRPASRTHLLPIPSAPIVFTSEIVLADKWAQPPAQPVRAPSRQTAIQAGVVQSFRTIVPETITLDKWYQQAVMLPNRRISQHASMIPAGFYQPVVLGAPVTAPHRAIVHWIE